MNLQPLTMADLFEENGTVARYCSQSWRDGGSCRNPARLVESPMPEDQREEYLKLANDIRWAKDDDERIYCPFCTQAMRDANEQ